MFLEDRLRLLQSLEWALVAGVPIGMKARGRLAITGAKVFRALQDVGRDRMRAAAIHRDEERGVMRRWERRRRRRRRTAELRPALILFCSPRHAVAVNRAQGFERKRDRA